MAGKKKLIQEYCGLLNGRYIEPTFAAGPMMSIQHGNFEIVFDYHVVSTGKSNVTYTRVRSVFKNLKDYELKIGKEGLFSKLGKAFGGQDIEIGDEIFDENHLIKSNDELLTNALLNDFEIKSRINFSKNFRFEIVKKNMMGIKCQEGELGLHFNMMGKLKHDVEVITLIELFQHTLNKLVNLEIASEDAPSTSLYKIKEKTSEQQESNKRDVE